MMKKLFAYLSAGVFLVCACTDPYQEKLFKAYEEKPVSEWLSAQDGEFSLWEAMLRKVDIYNALNLGVATYTCFVAGDGAVRSYLESNGYASIDDIPYDELDYLMRYHIIYGTKVPYSNLLLKLSSPTVSGDYLTAGINLQTGIRYIDNGEDRELSYIVKKDIEAANGVIHVLDRMLQPITASVWNLIDANPSYGIFADALRSTGRDAFLDNTYREIKEVQIRDNKTVLVVPDSVFLAHGVDSYQALEALVGPGKDMEDYVDYHIMQGLQGYAQLTTFPESDSQSMIFYNECPLRGYSIVDTLGTVIFNPHSPNDTFHISEDMRDIPAKNGYIHEIDGLGTIPSKMARYVVVYEPTDKFEFQCIPFYRMEKNASSTVDEYEIISNELEVPGIRWESVPESKAKVWYRSEYQNGRYMNCDGLFWNMGNIGWIEFEIPVLPLGKYTLYAEKSNDATNGGKYWIYWDGEEASLKGGSEINFAQGVTHPTWATHDIAREEKHTIRFTVASAGGVCGIDRFIFKPADK